MTNPTLSLEDWQWIARLIEDSQNLSDGDLHLDRSEPMTSGLGFLSKLYRVSISSKTENEVLSVSENTVNSRESNFDASVNTNSISATPEVEKKEFNSPLTHKNDFILPTTMVVKLCTLENTFESLDQDVVDVKVFDQNQWMCRIHDQECRFYTFVTKNPQLKLPLARMFGCSMNSNLSNSANLTCKVGQDDTVDCPTKTTANAKENEKLAPNACLILEDMSINSGLQYTTDGMTLGQIKSTVEAMATLHAFCYDNPSWKEERYFGDYICEDISGARPLAVQIGQQVHRDYPEWFTECHVSILEQIEKNSNLFEREFHAAEVIPDWFTITHGDLWVHNLLFEKTDEKISNRLTAILDWQFAAAGSPTQDIARLVASSVNTTKRRQNTGQILDWYYAQLTEFCDVPFSRSRLDELWCNSFQVATLITVMDTPALIEFAKTRPNPNEEVEKMVRRYADNLNDVAEKYLF